MKTTLVIMAAGIGSRYGGGIKQLAKAGPSGEIIMDYSIYDAIRAGFDKIVFVIRKDIEEDFKEIIGNRIAKVCDTEYVFQSSDDLPDGFVTPPERTKPWGTGQAILACRDAVKEPFAVINADDFYGAEAFVNIHNYLVNSKEPAEKEDICLSGYILGNTLSENGGVTRGVCTTDDNGFLVGVKETSDIRHAPDGRVLAKGDDGEEIELSASCHVSMNMWGLRPSFFEPLEKGFSEFLASVPEGNIKAEYLLPTKIDAMIKEGKATAKLIETKDKWFGITFKEDMPGVVAAIKKLVDDGVYPDDIMKALENR